MTETENERRAALRDYDILGSHPEQSYDDIVLLALHLCETPIAALGFAADDVQWFKAAAGLELGEVPHEHSFCTHTLAAQTLSVVPDTRRDSRFSANPLVTGEPHLRFYAGVPLVTAAGTAVGTLCVMDREPRQLDDAQKEALRALARQTMNQLELRRTARRLEESEQRFRAFMDNGPVVAFIKDEAGRMVYANKPFENRFQLERRQWQGKDDFELWPPEVARDLREHDRSVLADAETVDVIESVPTPDGRLEHWQVYKFPLRLGEETFLAGTALDITDLKSREMRLENYRRKLEKANQHLDALGKTDALTGLKNRRAFDEHLQHAVEHATHRGEPLSLLLLDVDKFKDYNDSFGHPAGDEALRKIAELLVETARKDDLIARYGGEELAVILPATALASALTMADRFRGSVATSDWPQRAVTVSIGAAALSETLNTVDALVASADAALYRAKENGRNRVMPADGLELSE